MIKAIKRPSRMYSGSVAQISPCVGCEHKCRYCVTSFQRQAKRQRKRCEKCADFEPHLDHFEDRLVRSKTKGTSFGRFNWLCSMGDVAFCDDDHFKRIVEFVAENSDRQFLLQSKDPGRAFLRIDKYPGNLMLGITLETNRDEGYEAISKAPKPSQRYEDFRKVNHNVKMITIEPVMAFDMAPMLEMISATNPCLVWLGYDSGNNGLPEPSLKEVRELHWQLSLAGYPVILKKIREGR